MLSRPSETDAELTREGCRGTVPAVSRGPVEMNGNHGNDHLLTPSDVAERLQVNERTVTKWLRKNDLRGYKIGKEWRVSDNDLKAFVEAGANLPPADR